MKQNIWKIFSGMEYHFMRHNRLSGTKNASSSQTFDIAKTSSDSFVWVRFMVK